MTSSDNVSEIDDEADKQVEGLISRLDKIREELARQYYQLRGVTDVAVKNVRHPLGAAILSEGGEALEHLSEALKWLYVPIDRMSEVWDAVEENPDIAKTPLYDLVYDMNQEAEWGLIKDDRLLVEHYLEVVGFPPGAPPTASV